MNIFKNTIGSTLFLIVASSISQLQHLSDGVSYSVILALIFSSFIGIIIGDTVWLASLRMIGSRRLIIVDALKPFMGAGLGYFLLDETISYLGLIGMLITVIGVSICALQLNKEDDKI